MGDLTLICLFLRDLMGLKEHQIIEGRVNEEILDDGEDYIVVDSLFDNKPETMGESFDEEKELLTLDYRVKTALTLDFIGPGAKEKLNNFTFLLRIDRSKDLQFLYGVSLCVISNMIDLKFLSGSFQRNRLQITLNAFFTPSQSFNVPRVEEINLEEIED